MSAPQRPMERIIPIKVLGDPGGGKVNMRMGTPSNGPSIITHHAAERERPKEGKRRSYLAEEEEEEDHVRDDNDAEGQKSRSLLVTFDDGTTTETQETDSMDFRNRPKVAARKIFLNRTYRAGQKSGP